LLRSRIAINSAGADRHGEVMVLDVNTHVGTEIDASKNNYKFDVFEFHSKSFSFGLFAVIGLIVVIIVGWFLLKRRFKRRQVKDRKQLAILYDGCTCRIPINRDHSADGSNVEAASSYPTHGRSTGAASAGDFIGLYKAKR
jgi:hypothetical protein